MSEQCAVGDEGGHMRRLGNGTVFVVCGVSLVVAWVVFALENAVKERLSRRFHSDASSGELAEQATSA